MLELVYVSPCPSSPEVIEPSASYLVPHPLNKIRCNLERRGKESWMIVTMKTRNRFRRTLSVIV